MHPSPLETVRSRARAAIAAALIALGAGLLAGCAENRSHLLPGDTVREISINLDRVRELADQGDCAGAVDAAQQVTRQIEGLGTSVDAKLRRSLRDGASRLVLAIQASCGSSETTTPAETEPVSPTVEPETTEENGTGTGETGKTGSGKEKAPTGTGSNGTGTGTGTGGSGGGTGEGGGSGTGGETGGGTGGSGGGTGGTGGGTGGSGGGTGGVGPPGG